MKKITNKQYVVIGLGRFGRSVALQLEENGCMVLAIDGNERNVNMVSENVTHAMCLDVTNEQSMNEIGLQNFDAAIISIGQNLDAAIFATMFAKEKGVPKVIVKAYDEMQGKILSKLGADEIIYPEREMGYHLAKNLAFGNFVDAIELSTDYSIAEIPVLNEWIGKNLIELKFREKYNVNVIAIKRNGELNVTSNTDKKFLSGDTIVVVGANTVLRKLAQKM